MTHCIYDINTTRFVRIMRRGYWQDATAKTERAAKALFTRLVRLGKIEPHTHAIAELTHFRAHIEKTETKRNLLSGIEFTQPVNTPASCDPSTETYHSM